MKFNSSYITNAGYELLLRAAGSASDNSTSGESTVVWLEACTSELDVSNTPDSDMVELTWSALENGGLSSSGTVVKSEVVHVDADPSATPPILAFNMLSLECALSTSIYSGQAKVFGVKAKLANQSDNEAVLAVVARPGNKQGVIPPVPEDVVTLFPGNDYTIDFKIRFINDNTISVTSYMPTTYYARASDFDALANRVVTTHSHDSDSTGENQTILGDKFFVGTTQFHDLVPEVSESYTLGSSLLKWYNLYSKSAELDSADIDSLLSSSITTNSLQINNDCIVNGNCDVGSLSTSGNITSSSTILGNNFIGAIGSSSSRSYVYASTVSFSASASLSGAGTSIISSDASILPSANATYDLGSSGSKWRTIYANNFNGVASSASILATSRTIDGVSFNGSSNIIHYGECSTTSSSQEKEVTFSNTISVANGTRIAVKFSSDNSHTSPKLKIGSTSYYIKQYGSTFNKEYSWSAGEIVEFIFSSNSWYWVGFQEKVPSAGVTTTATSATTAGKLENQVALRISDNSGTNYGDIISFDGSSSATQNIKLPSTINATIYGTASFAIRDGSNNIISSYVKDISSSYDSSSTVSTYRITHASGESSNWNYTPVKWRYSLGNSQSYRLNIASEVALAISGTDIGAVRLVSLKTSNVWSKNSGYGSGATGIYVTGTILHPAFLRTTAHDSTTVIRCDCSDFNTPTFTGTWFILHYLGSIASGDCVVALAVRVA